MKIAIEIDEAAVASCIDSALRHGVHYWAHVSGRAVREAFVGGGSEGKPGPWRVLSHQRVRRALVVMAEKRPRALARLLTGNADADVGDLLVQYIVLGEERYA